VEQISNEIRVSYADREINALLENIGDATGTFSRHYSQSEEFFLKLEREYTVPHLPIHHDVREPVPSDFYLEKVRGVIGEIASIAPQVLKDLVYFFDPAEILRPCFFKIYKVEEAYYLYLMRLDLMVKTTACRVIARGTNDTTPEFATSRLYLEPVVVPLSEVVRQDGKVRSFRILQTISQTWIGESGRGYFVQGIWMDMDLTKFFSKLFLPKGKRTYPFWPYICKYKTICHTVISLSPDQRKTTLPYLHRAIQFLIPVLDKFQSTMKAASFSEDLPYFVELKSKIPENWYEIWKDLKIDAYLNETEAKEFKIDG